MRRRALLLVGAAALAACGSPPPRSSELPTSELTFITLLQSNGSLAQLDVFLQTTDDRTVNLTPPDRLLFGPPGAEEPMIDLGTQHTAQIETAETDLDLILERAGGVRITSHLLLPPPFVLHAPPAPASRGAPMAVTWDVADGPFWVDIEVSGPCIGGFRRKLQHDTGAYTIQPADLAVADMTDACDFTVVVKRTWQASSLAPELAPPESVPLSLQVRTVTFTTAP